MTISPSIRGRYALVTGGSRSIGLAAAECLAAAGCNVILASRNQAACRKAAGRIEEACGVRALGARCDVTDRAAVHALFKKLAQDGPALTAL